MPTASLAQPNAFIPRFFDPNRHRSKPDTSNLRALHFITDDNYPPFHFALPDGTLTGFDVELAQAVCKRLKLPCTIQARRFDTQVEAINTGEGDALMAARPINDHNRAMLDFTAPYYRAPARFMALRSRPAARVTPETLSGKSIGVEKGTAHEAFLQRFFKSSNIVSFASRDSMRTALRHGDIDFAFGDGITSSFWLNGSEAAQCCQFAGGPFGESRYFGEGIGIAVRKGNDNLRRALDYALEQISEDGEFSDLYLKYFPVGFY